MDLEAQLVELSVWWAATLAFTEKICSVTQRKVSQANLKEEPDFQEALLLGIHQHSNHEAIAQAIFFCEESVQATTCTQAFTQTLQVPWS